MRGSLQSCIGLFAGMMLGTSGVSWAQLTPPAGPSSASSAKFTLGDIWNRLNSGATGTKRAGAFTEPGAGPGTATMKTTDDIMAAAPAADNTAGATASDVVTGMKFWGLRTSGGTWGLTTGTRAPAQPGKTGQTGCWNASGNPISCAGTGQDGDKLKGVAWPNPRFTDNGNGTVTDNLTGLIWLKDANCPNGTRTWQQALDFSNALANGQCGLTDSPTGGQWRLPNRFEMESLLDLSRFGPALPAFHPFTDVVNSLYWTSSTIAESKPSAWYVGLYHGETAGADKGGALYVWPVRGGQ